MKYLLLILCSVLQHLFCFAQSALVLAYTQQVYDTYMWKATELYKDCCYEESIEALEFCSRMNRNRYILSPNTFERMQFVPQKGNEEQVQNFIRECKKKRIGNFTCIGKERMILYATYQSDSKLDNVSFITPWRVNIKVPAQFINDAIHSAKIAKQLFLSKKSTIGNFKAHKNYREKLSEHKVYYRGTNWNLWTGLQTMSFYFWIDLAGEPTIEVKVTTNSYDTLVFYLRLNDLDTYINVLSKL